MKKLIAISVIVAGTFASAAPASALLGSFTDYPGWAQDAFVGSDK